MMNASPAPIRLAVSGVVTSTPDFCGTPGHSAILRAAVLPSLSLRVSVLLAEDRREHDRCPGDHEGNGAEVRAEPKDMPHPRRSKEEANREPEGLDSEPGRRADDLRPERYHCLLYTSPSPRDS